jgi:hypothetical protein
MPAVLEPWAKLGGRHPKTCMGRNRGMHARRAWRALSYGDF